MAYLELNVGPIIQQITASDANATRVLQGVLRQYGYDVDGMTGQQQANAVLVVLRDFLQDTAQAQKINAAIETARETATNDAPVFGA